MSRINGGGECCRAASNKPMFVDGLPVASPTSLIHRNILVTA